MQGSSYSDLKRVLEALSELHQLRLAAVRKQFPTEETDDPLAWLVNVAHRLLHEHPIAAQAAFAALVAEGRRAAETETGRRLLEAMAASPNLDGARRLWEASPLRLLREDPKAVLPTDLIDAWLEAGDAANLDDRILELVTRAP